ncbi:MAG: anti-sigma factor [Vicinamibacterales bacterium]
MRCDDLDDVIEAIAEGEAASAEHHAHVAGCAHCQARLAMARAVDRLLATRETPEPPAAFTFRVMERVGHAEWRAEQLVDVGFNVAVAAGIGLVVAGLVGLAWSLGWVTAERPTLEAVGTAIEPWLSNTLAKGPTVGLAALLLTSALGLWWWVEGEASL